MRKHKFKLQRQLGILSNQSSIVAGQEVTLLIANKYRMQNTETRIQIAKGKLEFWAIKVA